MCFFLVHPDASEASIRISGDPALPQIEARAGEPETLLRFATQR
jgi:hypothetical protein